MIKLLQEQIVHTSGVQQDMDTPFISMGYDYVRIGKRHNLSEVEQLKSICIESEGIFYYKHNRKISFEIYGTLIFLRICPPKLLRSENVRLATPEEMAKSLNKVQRETGLSFWEGYVTELHFTFTLQTPEPYERYRSLFQSCKGYKHESEEGGDYFNGKRITILFYDKAKETKALYSDSLQSEFCSTSTPELFRAEIKIKKEVRKVLMASGCWDKRKALFLASDLTEDQTFWCLTQFTKKFTLRFIKPSVNTIPQNISSEFSFFRLSSSTDNGFKALTELYEQGILLSPMYRRAIKHHNEAKQQERREYIHKYFMNKVIALLAEYRPKSMEGDRIKLRIKSTSRNKILSLSPKQLKKT